MNPQGEYISLKTPCTLKQFIQKNTDFFKSFRSRIDKVICQSEYLYIVTILVNRYYILRFSKIYFHSFLSVQFNDQYCTCNILQKTINSNFNLNRHNDEHKGIQAWNALHVLQAIQKAWSHSPVNLHAQLQER